MWERYDIVQTISLYEAPAPTHVDRLEVVMKLAWILSCSLGLAAAGCSDEVASSDTSGPMSTSSSSSTSTSTAASASNASGSGGVGGEPTGPGGSGGDAGSGGGGAGGAGGAEPA